MYPSTFKLQLRDQRRARRQQKFIIYFFSVAAAYIAGLATVMWYLSSIIG